MKLFKRKSIALSLALLMITSSFTGCTSTESSTQHSLSQECFNTVITLTINSTSGDESAEDIINECFGLCFQYERLFSKTIETSDVNIINTSQGQAVEVNPVVASLIEDSLYYSELSNGTFDITVAPLSNLWNFTGDTHQVPSDEDITKSLSYVNYKNISVEENVVTLSNSNAQIDLGGIAKGFVADKIKSYMIQMGVNSAIIDLGGNILTIGSKDNNENYNIGIKKPFGNADEYAAIVKVSDLSVVTSGVYERYFYDNDILYHHILDTTTGYPVDNNLLSVTIISNESLTGDALSTTCFALGLKKGKKLIESTEDVEAVFIDKDYNLHLTSGLEIDEENNITIIEEENME